MCLQVCYLPEPEPQYTSHNLYHHPQRHYLIVEHFDVITDVFPLLIYCELRSRKLAIYTTHQKKSARLPYSSYVRAQIIVFFQKVKKTVK